MRSKRVLKSMHERFVDHDFTPVEIPLAETVIAVPPELLYDLVTMLVDEGEFDYLTTITGQDTGEEIRLLYHFWAGEGLTIQVDLPRQGARVESIADLIPGAEFYELEIIEMLGVKIGGHPDPRPLLLPDDWEGDPPLRATASAEEE